eukprot:gene14889-biopygen2793
MRRGVEAAARGTDAIAFLLRCTQGLLATHSASRTEVATLFVDAAGIRLRSIAIPQQDTDAHAASLVHGVYPHCVQGVPVVRRLQLTPDRPIEEGYPGLLTIVLRLRLRLRIRLRLAGLGLQCRKRRKMNNKGEMKKEEGRRKEE